MNQTKLSSKDQLYLVKKMSDVNAWKEQYIIVGAPYGWTRFINFHGRSINEEGEIQELQERGQSAGPNLPDEEPTAEEYAEMSDIKRRLVRQTFLVTQDKAKVRRYAYYQWNEETSTTGPEPEDVAKQRGRAWVWTTQCFVNFPHLFRSCPSLDLFTFYAKLCEITKPPPPVIRQRVSQFSSTYLKKGETYLQFASRLNRTAEELRGLGKSVSDKDIQEALLGGVSYHAYWRAGENPQPQLVKSRFYTEVSNIDQHNSLSN
jgi:hypothetical protein